MLQKDRHDQASGRFAGKVIAVTGGASGIGRKIVEIFSREGGTVIVCDIDKPTGNKTTAVLREQDFSVEFLWVDLSQANAPQKMVRDIIGNWGRLDVLVNNARDGKRVRLLEENEASWEQGLAVMLRAPFFASQEAIRFMAENDGGAIVNIGSIAGVFACRESPVYHIAKAGLLQMTRYLAVHAGVYGVRVNAVLPGFIVKDEHQDRYRREDNLKYRQITEFCHPNGNPGSANQVAEAVLFLCLSQSNFINGQCLFVDGGLCIQDPSDLLMRFAQKYT